MERMNLAIGALAFLGAAGVIAYLAVTRDGPLADTAAGALIALVSAGGSYFLRGRVQPGGAENTDAPPTVTIRDSGPTRVGAPDPPKGQG